MASDDLDLTQAMIHADAVAACAADPACASQHRQLGTWLRELRTIRPELDCWRQKAADHQATAEDMADSLVELQEMVAGAHGQLTDDGLVDDDYDAAAGIHLLWKQRDAAREAEELFGTLWDAEQDKVKAVKAACDERRQAVDQPRGGFPMERAYVAGVRCAVDAVRAALADQ